MSRLALLCLAAIVASTGLHAQTPGPSEASPPTVYTPSEIPGISPPSAYTPPALPPPVKPAAGNRCEAFLRTPLGGRTILCVLTDPLPLAAECECPFPPPPPDLLPSPPASGHVIE